MKASNQMNPEISSDLNTGIHEAGHSVCATHFKIAALPEILHDGRSIASEMIRPDAAGLCSYIERKISPLQYAIISWGGAVAEALYGTPPGWFPPFKPTALLLQDWWAGMEVQIHHFSASDRAGIDGCYRQSWRACKTAFRIVTKNKARVRRLAQAITDGRKTPSMPLPEKFPASHADLVRVVCGNDAASFERFITGRAAMHLTNGTSNLDDARLALGTSFDGAFAMSLNLQRSIYAGDFKTEADWLAAARDFKAWETSVKNSTDQMRFPPQFVALGP